MSRCQLIYLFVLCALFCGIAAANDLDEISSYNSFANDLKKIILKDRNDISINCKLHVQEYVQGLLSGDIWALKMFDATAKPPSGILEGNFVELGSFDECLEIQKYVPNKGTIMGKYCLPTVLINISSKLPKRKIEQDFEVVPGVPKPRIITENGEIGMQMAVCMPNACSADDIQKIVYDKFGLNTSLSEKACQTELTQPKMDAGGIATLSFLGVVIWIMAGSTIYDFILCCLQKKPTHPILIAFSILTNGKKLLATSSSSNQISCLHGLRVISTMWVVLGHRYAIQSSHPIKNYFYLADWMNAQANMFIMGATVSVDTFFLMAGMVISYLYMASKQEFNIILYYVHRYLRLTPALAVVILIHVTLLQHLGSGPLWPNSINPTLIDTCEDTWWKALLYIQNYGTLHLCLPHSWYLSVDMQLFILSPILLIPLKKWPTVTIYATGFLTVCSILSCFLSAWFFELSGSIVGNNGPGQYANYWRYYYFPTWTRAAPWLIGIILGYYIYQVKQRRSIVMNKILVLCLWIASLAVLCTCVFAGHDLSTKEYSKVKSSFYIALVRPSWSIAVGWIIFACVTQFGGPVNWFLSLPVFQVLSKFTYSIYLVHYTVIYITTAQMRTPPIISNPREMYIFWGDFALSCVVAVFLTLAFESPIITIEKCIFPQTEKTETKQPSVSQKDRKIVAIA